MLHIATIPFTEKFEIALKYCDNNELLALHLSRDFIAFVGTNKVKDEDFVE